MRLGDAEREVLDGLFRDVHALLEGDVEAEEDPLAAMVGIGTAVEAPADPALARLLPDAHRGDPDASAEFRRYTELGLRERKRAGLALARATLRKHGTLRLDDEEARAWVVALTDVRLVLAERIGLRSEEDHELLVEVVEQLLEVESEAASESDDLDDAAAEQLEAGLRLVRTLDLYDYLTWLQETLVQALASGLVDDQLEGDHQG